MDTKKKSGEVKEIKRFACHSTCGFLVDLLEGHGFAVRNINNYGTALKKFYINIELMVDNESFEALLKNRLDKLQ